MTENDYTPGRTSIHTPNVHLCLASFAIEDMRKGDIYECTSSTVPGRKGERFEIKKLIDKQMLEHLMAYGDRFDRIHRGYKKGDEA